MKTGTVFAAACAVALLVVGANTDDAPPPTPAAPPAAVVELGTDGVEYDAKCDQLGDAFDVVPDNVDTRAAAQAACHHHHDAAANAPWPSGLHLVPLPTP